MAPNPPQGTYKTWNKYYSTVRFQLVRSGAGPFTWTLASGTELRAFGYAIQQDLGPVGFPAGTSPATLAETNIVTANSTLAGEKVRILGISTLLTSDSDFEFARLLWPNTSVQLSLNGEQNALRIGTLEMIPCGGGLCGVGDTLLTVANNSPPAQETYQSRVGVLSNGVAYATNFFPLPDPIIWNPQGLNDSTLVVKFRVERAITLTTTDRAGVAGGANTSGTGAYTSPAATAGTRGTYATVKAHLWSRQNSPRSENM